MLLSIYALVMASRIVLMGLMPNGLEWAANLLV